MEFYWLFMIQTLALCFSAARVTAVFGILRSQRSVPMCITSANSVARNHREEWASCPREEWTSASVRLPDTAGPEPALEPEEWMDGQDADPTLVSMRDGYVPPKSRELKVAKKNVLDTRPSTRKSMSVIDGSSLPPQLLEKLVEEVQNLKATVLSQEKRICFCDLENKLSKYTNGSLNKANSSNAHPNSLLTP